MARSYSSARSSRANSRLSTMVQKRIVLLPGDGIGPEIVREARRVLDSVAVKFGHSFEFQTQLIGGAAIGVRPSSR